MIAGPRAAAALWITGSFRSWSLGTRLWIDRVPETSGRPAARCVIWSTSGGIGFVPEDRRVFAELTVWENLDVAARAAGRSGYWTLDAVYGLFPKLRELRNRPGGYLSGGEQQMLTVAAP